MIGIEEKIYGNSTNDQKKAIDHIGTHARLLAGPGTGKTKTLTRRVLSLILKYDINPEEIILLTFTRLAATQLKDEIRAVLEPLSKVTPQVSTIHSFALKQILYNSSKVETLPRPIRIADDWEERQIIQEDLKKMLNLKKIRDIQKLINQLSADWETLRIDKIDWKQKFPNPSFLGAWQRHRELYGETLRAELVYQLKKQLKQNRDFQLDGEYKHILIDEYQDLNACDLEIVHELAKRDAELFVVGDDDQSIYGFRFATPEGIRSFTLIYQDAKKLALEICFRCDKQILNSAEFVADLDPVRLPKPTRPKDNAEDGEIKIIGFRDQNHEATSVAKKIKALINEGFASDQITILLRSDQNGALSKPIIRALKDKDVNVSLATDLETDTSEYRKVLSMIRLLIDRTDSLAWRTLIQVGNNGLGDQCISGISDYAQSKGIRFSKALQNIFENSNELPKFGNKVSNFVSNINNTITEIKAIEDQKEKIVEIINKYTNGETIKAQMKKYFIGILEKQEGLNLESLIKEISVSTIKTEQETEENAVNILTMHQAKGLTFDICFIVGAENEFIPGRNIGDKEGDERRLLYVSMTRARHKLFITYCSRRIGQQSHLGSNSGNARRSLTKFLKDSNIPIEQLDI